MIQANVLFINCPNVALFCHKPFGDLSMGACYVAGGLEHFGLSSDYYDFNLRLNSVRGSQNLSSTEAEVLNSLPALRLFLSGESSGTERLWQWARQLVDGLPERAYDYIGLSLDRIGYESFNNQACAHFALILATELKRRFPAKIFVGGRQNIKQLGQAYFADLASGLGQVYPVDAVFYRDGHVTFPKLIQCLMEGGSLDSPAAKDLLEKQSFFKEMKGIVPRYELSNPKDLLVGHEKIFPEFLRKLHPRISEIEPFFLVPYKFSLGCPFKCAFCDEGESDYYADLGVGNIVNVLSALKKKGYRYFRFFNNNINPSAKFVHELHAAMKEAKLNILFSDSANLRVVSEPLFRMLSEMGCVKLWYGTETVSDRIQQIINKRVGLAKVEAHLQLAASFDIWNSLNIIYNFPHETEQDFRELLNFLETSPLIDACAKNEFMLMSGTAYANRPEQFGVKLNTVADNGLIAAYDEIGGLGWKEKSAMGAAKMARVDSARPFLDDMIYSNDQVYFALRQVYSDRAEVRRIVDDLVTGLKARGELQDFANSSGWGIPKNAVIDSSGPSYIRGNLHRHGNTFQPRVMSILEEPLGTS